jgi:hypothetical protein
MVFEKAGRSPESGAVWKELVARKVVSLANHLARIWLVLLKVACSMSFALLRIRVMVTPL